MVSTPITVAELGRPLRLQGGGHDQGAKNPCEKPSNAIDCSSVTSKIDEAQIQHKTRA